MKNKTILISVILGLITIGILVFLLFFFSKDNEKSFYRVEPDNLIRDSDYFRVDNNLRRIYFKKGKQETQLEDIPSINGYL